MRKRSENGVAKKCKNPKCSPSFLGNAIREPKKKTDKIFKKVKNTLDLKKIRNENTKVSKYKTRLKLDLLLLKKKTKLERIASEMAIPK